MNMPLQAHALLRSALTSGETGGFSRIVPPKKFGSRSMTKSSMNVMLDRLFVGPGGCAVTGRVGIPVKSAPEAEEWSCAYQIEGLGDGRVRQAYGVDAIQAMMLTLIYLSTRLYTSEEYKAGELVWENGNPGDLGLSKAEAVADMLRGHGS